jgi:hypothetical protein
VAQRLIQNLKTQDTFKIMENLFFNIDYSNFENTLIKLLLFILLCGFLLYFLFLVFSKVIFRKIRIKREVSLRLTFLWSIFAFFIIFNTYIFVLFYHVGIDSMNFTYGRFYLGIFSQILIYVAILTFFFIKRHSLKKLINENTLI